MVLQFAANQVIQAACFLQTLKTGTTPATCGNISVVIKRDLSMLMHSPSIDTILSVTHAESAGVAPIRVSTHDLLFNQVHPLPKIALSLLLASTMRALARAQKFVREAAAAAGCSKPTPRYLEAVRRSSRRFESIAGIMIDKLSPTIEDGPQIEELLLRCMPTSMHLNSQVATLRL